MKATSTRFYLMTALSILAVTAYAETANTTTVTTITTTNISTGIAGSYKCQRVDGSNTASYPLNITKTGDTYTLEWDDASGNPAMYGTGIMHPVMPNVLTSSFWNITNTDIVGVEIFQIKPDGSLLANWVLQSGKTTGTETCTKG